jgi:hypothetical protein
MPTNSLERGADRFMNEQMILIYPGSMLKSLVFQTTRAWDSKFAWLWISMSAMDVLINTVRKKRVVHTVTDPRLRFYRAVCRAFWCSPLIVLRTVDALSSHFEVHDGR